MPAIPEIADIPGEKRPIEVFRSMDTEEITQSNGKSAVAGKIKKQIEAVRIHVAEQRREAPTTGGALQPVLFNERGENEFVKEPPENAMHRAIEIDKEFSAGSGLFPLTREALVTVNWPGRNGWKEKKEHQEIERPRQGDDFIAQAKYDIQCPKRDVGNSKKTKLAPRRHDRKKFGRGKRKQTCRDRSVERPAALCPAFCKYADCCPLPDGETNDDPDLADLEMWPNV